VLDRNRLDVYGEPLVVFPNYIGGAAVEYKAYQSSYGMFEATDGGTAIFVIEDALGEDIGTALYTPDYQRGRVDFVVDTGGAQYYLTGRSYDINGAAAEVWRQKGGAYASVVDFSTDNHSVHRGAVIKNCMDMAARYDALSRPQTLTVVRTDNAY
jgi:hypothetical protein